MLLALFGVFPIAQEVDRDQHNQRSGQRGQQAVDSVGSVKNAADAEQRRKHQPGQQRAAGIAGALGTGLVVGPLLGLGSILDGRYSIDGLLTALAGSLVVLVAVNVLRDRENAD